MDLCAPREELEAFFAACTKTESVIFAMLLDHSGVSTEHVYYAKGV